MSDILLLRMALMVVKVCAFMTMRAFIIAVILGSLSNVGVFTLRVFFGTNHSYGWCHSFCSKVEYVL